MLVTKEEKIIMFTIEEINQFKSELNNLLSSYFDEELVNGMLSGMQLEIALSHDAKLLESEVRKYLSNLLTSDNENLMTALIKGTTTLTYKAKIAEVISTYGKK